MPKKAKQQQLSLSNLVEKRNILVELKNNSMTLQELRFFSIYLSKINARYPSTRAVRFKLDEFQRIMEFGKLNIKQLQDTTDSLLQHIVHVPTGNGGYTAFQLFKECTVDQDKETGEWFVEIDAHDKALPLMFELKGKYFTYELWNALHLKSANQLKMYELLKEYENFNGGKREVMVSDLRHWLGIADNEYPRWDNLRDKVINVCQKALSENTDICFTYERGKTGQGGKWLSIIFHIKKNPNHVDQLSLSDFIKQQPDPDVIVVNGTSCEPDESSDKLPPLTKQLYKTLKSISDRHYGKYDPGKFTEYTLNSYIRQAKESTGLDDNTFIIAYISECFEHMCKERSIHSPDAYLTTVIQRRYTTIPLDRYGVEQVYINRLQHLSEKQKQDITVQLIGKYRMYKRANHSGNELTELINIVADELIPKPPEKTPEELEFEKFLKMLDHDVNPPDTTTSSEPEQPKLPFRTKLPEYYVVDGDPDCLAQMQNYADQGIRSVEVLSREEYDYIMKLNHPQKKEPWQRKLWRCPKCGNANYNTPICSCEYKFSIEEIKIHD